MTKITNGDEKFVNDALISCRRREEKKGEPLECSITLCASCLGPPMATYRWQKHTLDESPLLAIAFYYFFKFVLLHNTLKLEMLP